MHTLFVFFTVFTHVAHILIKYCYNSNLILHKKNTLARYDTSLPHGSHRISSVAKRYGRYGHIPGVGEGQTAGRRPK